MISHCPRGLFDLRKKRQREVCNWGARGLVEPGQGLCEPGMEEKWKSLLMHMEMAFPLGAWPPSCRLLHRAGQEGAEEPFQKEKAASAWCNVTSATCKSSALNCWWAQE